MSGPDADRELFRSARTVVRVARHAGADVVVKTPAAPIPDPSEVARYRRERAALDAVAGPGVPAVVDLVDDDGTIRLVTAWHGGRSLAAWMAERRLSVTEVLDILEEAAAILARVHAAALIHRDVGPANLVWGGRPQTLELVDFGSSVREGVTADGQLEGTLCYLAPEATGRLGHPVTWRSDLYSLGATAWHLLVGRPPFPDDDPLALVHAHLARAPEPPHAIDPAIPPSLSAIVLHLLEKDPERRYQSADGLLADLRRCRAGLARGEVTPFELGQDDVPPRFAIPTRVYGRDAEAASLATALARVDHEGVSLAVVSGPSGIGKSALVEQLAGTGARLVRGRFELLGHDTPLRAVSEACEALVAELLVLDEGALAASRERLRGSLGDDAALLARTIPSLGVVLGALEPAPELSDQASAVRTLQAHAALLGALAGSPLPVVLFLDDLQWADTASLDLLEFLVGDPSLRGLLLVGGYRDDEVGPDHPLTHALARLEAGEHAITRIRLSPLDPTAATSLVADACRCPREEAAPLAAALCERSGGNPFFLRTLLQQLHDRGLLQRRAGGWTWSPDAPSRLALADNVVDAVLERLGALPADTARALGVAARIGHRFDLALLARALDRSDAEVAAALTPGIDAGLVHAGAEQCRFVHDRVQEAALRLLDDHEAPAVHLRIARALTADGAAAEGLRFDALEHHHAALSLVTDDAERIAIARLALEASTEAVRRGAFAAALRACELGLEALGRRDPQLWEQLCTRAVEVADAAADEEGLDRHADALIAGASSVAAMAPAYVARIRAQTRAERFTDAIDTANAFLARVGGRVNTRMNPVALVGRLARVLWAMRGRSAEELIDGPVATDPTQAAVLRVQVAAAKALASTHPAVLPLDILIDMDHVLTHGVTGDGLFAWTGWAMLVTEALKRPDLGVRYGRLALARAERMRASSWADIAWVVHSTLDHWQTPLVEVEATLRRTRDRALEAGEISAAVAVSSLADQLGFFLGKPLSEVDQSFRRTGALARQYRMAMWGRAPLQDAVAALRGELDPAAVASDSGGGSFAEVDQAMARLITALFLRDREAAWNAARNPPAVIGTPLRSPPHFIWYTYHAVAVLRAAAVGLVPAEAARRSVRPGRALIERWARAHPARRYRLLWIDATDAALDGNPTAALTLYEQAIDLARSRGIRHDAALMAEHAAEVVAAVRPRLRTVFLEEAIAGYRQWGATAMADRLDAQLPPRPSSTSTSSSAGDLDVETLFRASLSLSGEIRLDRLVSEVVAVTLQNAGATRGFLIVERDGELRVEVGRSAEGAELCPPGSRLAETRGLASTVVRYVARTGDQLVLADGTADARFSADPHLRGGAAASILCTPLVHKGRRTGIIYLENHLIGGCFTPARLQTVQVLAAQAAVALENASLVDHLEARVEERTSALQAALDQTREQHEQLVSSHQALVHGEKMAALGRLVAGVAHELNTPLGSIKASVGNLDVAVQEVLGGLIELLAATAVAPRAEWAGLVQKAGAHLAPRTTREERAARRTLATRLDEAGVANSDDVARVLLDSGLEPNDDLPLEMLRDPARDALLRGAYNMAAIVRNGRNIGTAADRAAKIVFALRSYAHPGDAGGESTRTSLAERLDTVLTLYHNQIKHHVELVREYEDPGEIEGRHDELDQVWTNLVHNALQAMEQAGQLGVSIRGDADEVSVTISDTGRGIPADQIGRVFEPFYTTKPVGEGTGLGLSICRDIVHAHGGRIGVESVPGRTRFTVRLPRGQGSASQEGGEHKG